MVQNVVELDDVWMSFGSLTVLKGLSLSVASGEGVAIMGRSGSGKTTLLKIIAGIYKPARGIVRVLGHNLHNSGVDLTGGRTAYIPQSIGLVEGGSALYNVLLARAPSKPLRFICGLWSKRDVEDALEALRAVGLESKAMTRVEKLSGGEKQRVAIARAMLQGAKLILADEPVSNLDLDTAESILAKLMGLADKGITIISVMHDYDLAFRYFKRVYVLVDGRLRELA